MIRRIRLTLLTAALAIIAPVAAREPESVSIKPPLRPVLVGAPVVPTLSPAVRDLPDWVPDPNLFGLEMKRREDFGFIPIEYPIKPRLDPLFSPQPAGASRLVDSFGTPVHNYAGQASTQSPPDTTGDVGPTYFVQATNQSVSTVAVLNKATGSIVKTFTMQSLAGAAPCNHGFCDPVVQYDRAADRWLISELPSSGGNVCVYVSTTGDPTGTWFAYTFPVETGSVTDYPKYGVWPQNGNGGSYLVGVNAGSGGDHDLFALDRAKMLGGQPASFQKFSVPDLPNLGFQLVLPSTFQGSMPPPDGEPAVFIRPHDDEALDGTSTPSYDTLDLWTLDVDWATPANSTLTQLAPISIGDFDMTLCGIGSTWDCMPQPNTPQMLDPIREPLHFPLQYRNFGERQTLVGTFPEDVDGTDHAALRWFELRKTAGGSWSLFQEGLVGGEANVHRSVGSIGMDGSGNIAMGYTRTGTASPYFPSIYYRGRLAADPPGSMPQGEFPIFDGSFSKTNNERWGDYAGLGVDPADDCTFWFTTEYMTSNSASGTRVAAFKFDSCGCAAVPSPPVASATTPQNNRIDVGWNDSATGSIIQYFVDRSTTAGGPYAQIAIVSDSSAGVGGGAPYTYHDDTVSGGTRYYYIVKSSDGAGCLSGASAEVSAVATGNCLLAPTFLGIASVSNPGNSTCALNLSWSSGASNCAGGVTYSVYRGTTPNFTPSPANRIAGNVAANGFTDAVGIASGTTYYYVVRAVDGVNGLEDGNNTHKSGSPTGPLAPTSWSDTFEGAQSGGGFDQIGWTHAAINGTTNWAWSTSQKHDGTHSWFAADVTTTSDKVLVTPPFVVDATSTLSFYHTYKFEFSSSTCWDGGTLEVTTNGGASWSVVPDADFAAGGFNGTISATDTNPLGGKRAWCNGTIAAMTLVTVNLGADANLLGKTVQVRWHEGDDTGNSSSVVGWYVDSVSLSNVESGGACATGQPCTGPGAPSLTSAVGDCGGVQLSWTAGAGSTSSYNVFRASASGGPYAKLFGMPVSGTSYHDATAVAGATYFYVVTGACDASGVTESLASNEAEAARLPDGFSCDDGNPCTLADACGGGSCQPGAPAGPPPETANLRVQADKQTYIWDPQAGSPRYDVVRGSLSALPVGPGGADEACFDDLAAAVVTDGALPGPGAGFWYLSRGENACAGAGSFGTQGLHGAPGAPRVTSTCP